MRETIKTLTKAPPGHFSDMSRAPRWEISDLALLGMMCIGAVVAVAGFVVAAAKLFS